MTNYQYIFFVLVGTVMGMMFTGTHVIEYYHLYGVIL